MSGNNQRKSRKIKKSTQEHAAKSTIPEGSEVKPGDRMAAVDDQDHTKALRVGLASISKDIKTLHQNIRGATRI